MFHTVPIYNILFRSNQASAQHKRKMGGKYSVGTSVFVNHWLLLALIAAWCVGEEATAQEILEKCYSPAVCTKRGGGSVTTWKQIYPNWNCLPSATNEQAKVGGCNSGSANGCTKGDSGARGAKGEPGESNKTAVEYLLKEVRKQKAEIEQLKRELFRNGSLINMTKQQLLEYHDKCPVKYGAHCFFGIFVASGRVNYGAAKLLCQQRGAQIANIYSSYHYDALLAYLRPWIDFEDNDNRTIGIRTGMKFNVTTNNTSFSNGTPASYVPWTTGYPVTGEENTNIQLHVTSETSLSGLKNGSPNIRYFGVLCQVKF